MKPNLLPLLIVSVLYVAISTESVLGQSVLGPTTEGQVVESATAVLQEVMAVPAKQIPQSLLANARGVAIVPNVVKGGFVVGVRFGRGVMLIRDDNGHWQPPMFVSLTGGSVGWQAGLQATDVVLVFKTRKSVNNLMNGKLTIGADASAAAGPVGREMSAATDARLQAEIYSYSRSRGLFAGLALDGSVVQVDHLAGLAYYRGHTGAVPSASVPLPASAVRLMNQLAQYSNAPQVAEAAVTHSHPHLVPVSEVIGPSIESLRQQLAASSQRLQNLLDPQWKSYLQLPREVFVPDRPASVDALKQVLQRFEAVQQDQRFASLAQRTEFASTYRLLREYTNAMARGAAPQLTLPPPPGNVP